MSKPIRDGVYKPNCILPSENTQIKHQLSFFILTVFKIPERNNGGKECTADLY